MYSILELNHTFISFFKGDTPNAKTEDVLDSKLNVLIIQYN
jgi:hypothetical protein